MNRKYVAELLGTMWLVLGGCGSAVIAAAFPGLGIGLLGVSLAFGLTVLTMAYAFGHISGAHFNPAVTVGLAVAGRHPVTEVVPYIVAQCFGAIIGAGILFFIASGSDAFNIANGFAANGFGAHSPGGYSLTSGLLIEAILTFGFVMVILGATSKTSPAGFAPMAIGLCLTLIHLISIPVTNTSVNPARSLGPAVFAGDWAIEQLWMFWTAPFVGAIGAGLLSVYLLGESGFRKRLDSPDRTDRKRYA